MTARIIATAALLAAVSLPAAAVDFDFYKLGRGAGDFLPTDGIACTGGDLCSSNVGNHVFNGDLTFMLDGITARATGSFNSAAAAVIQDGQSNWTPQRGAGLGVYHKNPVDNSDDNITGGETLTITFDQVVNLSALGLRSDGHNYTNWGANDTFLLDGASTLLPAGTGTIGGLDMTGSAFTFAFGGTRPAQFYLASMSVTAVPEPGTYALMIAGLGVTGFIARRRKRQG